MRLLLAAWLASAVAGSAFGAEPTPPNIVLMMVDDLGVYDLGCYGFEAVDTPNVDKLAQDGMLFTQAYAAAPVCSPSRAAVLSGQSPARLHLTNHISTEHFAPDNPELLDAPALTALPPTTVTYAERLRDAGYVCAHFGKWHLSLTKHGTGNRVTDPATLPDNQGFLTNISGNGAGGPASWFSPYKNPYIEDGSEGEYLPYRLADEAIAFMRTHRDRPFLVNFWNWTVHSPLGTTDTLVAKYEARRRAGAKMSSPVYAGMIEATDQVLGRLLTALDELGLRDNTIVVFASDNGGIKGLTNRRGQSLRMGKGWLYDGGLRIPMVVRWPGRVAEGAVSDLRVTHTDLFPTFLEVAGAAPDPQSPLDGESLVPLFTGEGEPERDALYFHYPNYAWHSKNRLGGAIIQGDYKLLNWYDDDSAELYHLTDDRAEQRDLADEEPDVTYQMKRQLKQWLRDSEANMPTRNQSYEAG